MFMIKSVSKFLFGDSSKENIIEIPQGQLYLVRPLSPKGYSELLFKDAAASIRRTGQEFQYQLVIQRAYEEGEEELLADDEDGETGVEGLGSEKDEKTFLLDEALHLRTELRDTGEKVIAWRDLSGEPGDIYQFVCENSVEAGAVASFELVAARCQYERKYRTSGENASGKDLDEFSFLDDGIIPVASPIASPARSPTLSPSQSFHLSSHSPGTPPSAGTMARVSASERGKTPSRETPTKAQKPTATSAPQAVMRPEGEEVLAHANAELHLFDLESAAFILQDEKVEAKVFGIGKWQYWLQIKGPDRNWLGQEVIPDISPVFNFEYLSFIFNHYDADGQAYSWLLRFKDRETEEEFQHGVMQALWQHLNEMQFSKIKDKEREYVMEAFEDLTMEDADEKSEDEEESEEEDDDDGQRSERYDSDESEDDVRAHDDDGNVNSQLAVGYKNGRSFVVRGSKIGVFKQNERGTGLEFATNISKVQAPGAKGKLFNPNKVMLHMQDQNMILQNPDNPYSLYRMDLERGQVVDEWKVSDDIAVRNFAPESKFAQTTGEQTVLGLSHNALYRIDPRLAGDKLVHDQFKQYATKNDFSGAATTDKGYVAVASNKGDIRMYDRLGINAKTLIPALGDPITGIDVSADGRWVLATTRTYLLLIDALQKEGTNAGKLGFEKSFAKDAKPQPRRLALTPAHVAQFQHETKVPIAFTPAHFNQSPDSGETTIITATGPFIITWSMKKVLDVRRDPYSIKRYTDEVKADNFSWGTDKNMIVTLPNEVSMVDKKQLKRPTRESIASPSLVGRGSLSTPRRSGRGSNLRSEIVNSPY